MIPISKGDIGPTTVKLGHELNSMVLVEKRRNSCARVMPRVTKMYYRVSLEANLNKHA